MKLSPLSCAVILTAASGSSLADTHSANETEVMVITATKNQVSIREAPASITVIDSEELNQTPVNDVASALEKVPGLQVVRNSGSEPFITIRGLKNNNSARNNYTLLLVNGRRITSAETMVRGASFDFSSIPINAIERIEVIRGPMSALYGSDALGGVVNVILKQPTNETQVNASVTYSHPEQGGGEMKKGSLFVSGTAIPDKLWYSLSAETSRQDDWYPHKTASGKTLSGNAQDERTGFNGAFSWLVNEQNTLLFDIGYMKNDRVFPGTNKQDSSDDNINNAKKYTFGLGQQAQWDWGESDIYYLYERSAVYEDNPHPLLGITHSKQQNHSLDAKVNLTQFERQAITAGFDLSHTLVNIDQNYDGTQKTGQQAIFIQDQIRLTEQFSTTLSGRLTHHNDFGHDFTPRIYLVYSPTQEFTIKGGYAEGFKTPSIYQSSKDFSLVSCGGSCYLTGNPDLKPEKSKTYELAASYAQKTWSVQATAFTNQLTDMIDRDTSTRPTGWITYQNIDKAQSKGLELEGQLNISEHLFLNANATYTKTKDKSTHLSLDNVPRWLSHLTLNWSATDALSFYSSANYTGKQWNSYNNVWLDPYVVANLGAHYRLNPNWNIKAGITNVLDKSLATKNQDYSENIVGRTYFITLDMAL